MHLLSQLAGIAALVLFCVALMGWVYGGRKPPKAYTCGDKNCPECGSGSEASPGLRPEEAERPALPPQIIVHLSLSERMDLRPLSAQERALAREYWEAFKATEDEKRKG